MDHVSSIRGAAIDRLADQALAGDGHAACDLGMIFSSGGGGVAVDLVAAHKWFNLAVQHGNPAAQGWRAEIAEEMTAREIAEAQRQARALVASTLRLAA